VLIAERVCVNGIFRGRRGLVIVLLIGLITPDMGCGSSKEQATVEVRLRDGAKHEDRSFKRQDQATDKLVIR
jgi:hypothetical protein